MTSFHVSSIDFIYTTTTTYLLFLYDLTEINVPSSNLVVFHLPFLHFIISQDKDFAVEKLSLLPCPLCIFFPKQETKYVSVRLASMCTKAQCLLQRVESVCIDPLRILIHSDRKLN